MTFCPTTRSPAPDAITEAHRIERLMVLCNFALLAGSEPKNANDWFLEGYVDAYDRVVTPIVIGRRGQPKLVDVILSRWGNNLPTSVIITRWPAVDCLPSAGLRTVVTSRQDGASH